VTVIASVVELAINFAVIPAMHYYSEDKWGILVIALESLEALATSVVALHAAVTVSGCTGIHVDLCQSAFAKSVAAAVVRVLLACVPPSFLLPCPHRMGFLLTVEIPCRACGAIFVTLYGRQRGWWLGF
jgi:hypothetical protein